MPSSLIFVGLVVLWLLILVPTVARRQQEVARLSPALLGGRVLERPMRHRIPEVGVMERSGPTTVGELVGSREDLPDDRYDADLDTDLDAEDDAEIDDDGRVHRWVGDTDDPDGDEHGPADLHDLADDDLADDDLADDDLTDDDLTEGDLADDAGPAGPVDEVGAVGRVEGGRERDPRPPADRDGFDRDGYDQGGYDQGGYDHDGYDDGFADGLADGGPDPDDRDDDVPEGPLPARYRPGRGGFDPEAAAAAAHAKYAFRQRVVLALLVLVGAAVGAALLVATVFWWVAGGLVAALAGYLTYLRRQVRIEESIRVRRAARLTGARRGTDDRRDTPADTDRDAEGPAPDAGPDAHDGAADRAADRPGTADGTPEPSAEGPGAEGADGDWTADDGEPTRVRGTGEPLGVLPARRRTVDRPASTEHESSLPRLAAAPPPPVPAGTSLVDVDAEEDVETLDEPGPHRRAVGE